MSVIWLGCKAVIVAMTGTYKGLGEILITKPTRCTNFSNLFLEWNSTCFGQSLCPSSGVQHCTHGNGICHTGYADCLLAGSGWNNLITLASSQQNSMTYTIAVCAALDS